MYECRIAYRHSPGVVEGFLGFGWSRARAKTEAIDQIHKKIAVLVSDGVKWAAFDKANVVTSPSTLTRAELDIVQADWRSGARY